MIKIKIPVILALDISTTCTAVCVLNAVTGEHIITYHSLMNNVKKFTNFWAKVRNMKNVFNQENNETWEIKKIAVEESAKRFTPGFSSADTIITLSKFNAILCYILLEKYSIEPTYINVRSARKKLGIVIDKTSNTNNKQQILNQIVEKYPNLPWIYKEIKGKKKLVKINEDRCDAFIIGLAAYKQ